MAVRTVMSQAIERILEEARSLTPEERRQLLESLQGAPPVPACTDSEFAGRVYGKYAHVRTSSEEFCARRADEISLEDRSGRP
jgi:hypothetical protein